MIPSRHISNMHEMHVPIDVKIRKLAHFLLTLEQPTAMCWVGMANDSSMER
jgi:hypothetical protein